MFVQAITLKLLRHPDGWLSVLILSTKKGGLSTASSKANASEPLACRGRLCERADNTELLHQAESIPVPPTLHKLFAGVTVNGNPCHPRHVLPGGRNPLQLAVMGSLS